MALLRCILGKFLDVVCHCFPPYIYIYIILNPTGPFCTNVSSSCPRVKGQKKRVEMLPVLKTDVQGSLYQGNLTKIHQIQGTDITQTNLIHISIINYVFLFSKKKIAHFVSCSFMRNEKYKKKKKQFYAFES